MNRPYVVGSFLGQIGSIFSLACLVYRSRSVKLRSVELPMKENVSGYSRNPCSLNRERDTAFAAKLLMLPTGFFSAEKWRGWRVRQYDLTTSLRQRRRRAISQRIGVILYGFRLGHAEGVPEALSYAVSRSLFREQGLRE